MSNSRGGKKKAPQDDAGLIVGRNPVREALERRAGQIEKVMLQKGGRGLDGIRRAASEASVPVQYVPQQRLNHIAAGLTHQGVVAIAAHHDVLRADVSVHDIEALSVYASGFERIIERTRSFRGRVNRKGQRQSPRTPRRRR